jgi:hypothetical protein
MAIKIMQKMADADPRLPSKDVLGVTAKLKEKVDLATKEAKENKYEPVDYVFTTKGLKKPVYESDEDYDDEKKKSNAAKRLMYDKMREIELDDLEDEIFKKYGKQNYDDNVMMLGMKRDMIKNSIEQQRNYIKEARENIKKGIGKRKPIFKNEVNPHGESTDELREFLIKRNEENILKDRPRRLWEEQQKGKMSKEMKEKIKGMQFGTTENP